ncbi:hypothetical protein [Burkholderia pseudomallei]|uniref:hypothetical protein n=1 Tax=Burkholderia pseudomallei TaxID=28450 RepID=UPI001178A929|nr:hypothetical protein [Burkholderia pseudomallei]
MRKTTLSLIVAAGAAAVCAAFAFAANHDKPVSLAGIQPAMSLDAVRQARATGVGERAGLYCRGDGDVLFEAANGLADNDVARISCVWTTTGFQGQRELAPIAMRGRSSTDYRLTFAPAGAGRWRLESFRISFPFAAYGDVVSSETEALGEPDELIEKSAYALVQDAAVQWKSGAGTLSVSASRGFLGGPVGTTVQLKTVHADNT